MIQNKISHRLGGWYGGGPREIPLTINCNDRTEVDTLLSPVDVVPSLFVKTDVEVVFLS